LITGISVPVDWRGGILSTPPCPDVEYPSFDKYGILEWIGQVPFDVEIENSVDVSWIEDENEVGQRTCRAMSIASHGEDSQFLAPSSRFTKMPNDTRKVHSHVQWTDGDARIIPNREALPDSSRL
jgi:hypothetical protein